MTKEETQKFEINSLVMIDNIIHRSISNRPSGKRAIVIGTYDQLYGGGDINRHSLYIECVGKVS